jgi:hypothetical protein
MASKIMRKENEKGNRFFNRKRCLPSAQCTKTRWKHRWEETTRFYLMRPPTLVVLDHAVLLDALAYGDFARPLGLRRLSPLACGRVHRHRSPSWPCRRGRLLLTRSSALVYADVGRPHRLRIGRTVVPGRSASAKVAPSFSRSLASAHVVSCRHCPGCLCSLRQCHCPLRLRFTARAAITQDAHRAVLLRLCIFSRPSSSSYCACARAPAVVPCLCLCSRSLCCACRPGCCRCVDRLSYCCACASSRGRRDILVQEEN